MKLGIWELLVILAIALLIFGPKALPKLGKSLGKTVGNFKKGLGEDDEDEDAPKSARAETVSSAESGQADGDPEP